MIAEIQEWLDGARSYRIGRALYSAYGQDAELKALFAEGDTDWNRCKLAEVLDALAHGTVAKEAGDEYAEMPTGGDDAVLNALQAEWQPLYQQMNYQRHELDKYTENDATSDAIRKKLAFEILTLEQQCMAIWAKRDYYQKHSRLPETAEGAKELPTEPVRLATLIENLKRNIRRNKKKAAKEPDHAEYPALVKKYEDELNTLTHYATHQSHHTSPGSHQPQEPGSH